MKEKLIPSFFVLLLFLLTANITNAKTEKIYGTGEKVVGGNTTKWCPNPSTNLCATFDEDVTGNPAYPDLLTEYDSQGNPIANYEVMLAGYDENGVPYFYVNQGTGGGLSNATQELNYHRSNSIEILSKEIKSKK